MVSTTKGLHRMSSTAQSQMLQAVQLDYVQYQGGGHEGLRESPLGGAPMGVYESRICTLMGEQM